MHQRRIPRHCSEVSISTVWGRVQTYSKTTHIIGSTTRIERMVGLIA